MDLTPAFLDRWREHRDLDYLDKVRDVVDQAGFDEPWLAGARLRAFAQEARATLHLSGIEVDEETVKAIVDRGETGGADGGTAGAVQAYAAAHRAAVAATAVTPALLEELHALLCAGTAGAGSPDPATAAPLTELCDWLTAPPDELHPVVVATIAHVELLRLRRWPDGNARLARLALLSLLTESGYGYRGLLAPSTHWSDPGGLPPAAQGGRLSNAGVGGVPPNARTSAQMNQLPPNQSETLPAVEHVVHGIARAVREMVNAARAEESPGSTQAVWFGFPIQP